MSGAGSTIEERHQQRIQSAKQALADGKKITAGRYVAGGNFVLGPDLLQMMEDKRLQNEEKEIERQMKKVREFRKLKANVDAIKERGRPNNQLNVSELRTMVSWYKFEYSTDGPVPTTKQ